MKSIIKYLPIAAICLTACEKNELNVVDIPFSVEKTTVNVGETVNFSIGSGADASSIYFGDQGTDFQKSRIALVEMKGYDENYLRNNLVAERIPGLKEYYYRIPNSSTVSPDLSFEGGEIKLYEGKLVSWDVSNSTLSKYIQITPKGDGTPQTLTIKP
ncbi:MAG: DUF5017 domain-containing protein, partial [Spirosomaceae bacterium]|nr:DUF5017 domain-containing protein [Spirosomataceae bacterium]